MTKKTKKAVGRPKKYTKKWIENYADEMLAWFIANPREYFIIGFLAESRVGKQRISEFARDNDYFSELYEQVTNICEHRLTKVLIEENTVGAKFALARRHDWVEKQVIEQTTELNINGSFADAIKELDD
jgi:hypothetical protein